MKISIAMATYNGAKYLQEQLDSFVSQTRQPDELVVCDDCSSDETVVILNHFAKTAPFQVRIFVNEKNLGYSQNFGRVLSLCEGDLIFLSDQDDVWFKEKIETIQQLADQDKITQIFMNDAELVHHDLSPTGLTKQGQIKSAGLSNSSFVMGCCMAIRRDFLKHLLPIPIEYKGHDTWLCRLGEELQRRKIISQTLQLYRRHENNESKFIANKTRAINKVDVVLRKIRIIFNLLKNNSDSYHLIPSIITIDTVLQVLTKWIEETHDQLLKNQLNEFKISQQKVKENLQERIKIRQMSLINRLFYGGNFYLRHGYENFSGIRSYIKDILSGVTH